MKARAMIITALLTAGLGIGAASTPVNASSWHKGSPKFLVGSWRTKRYNFQHHKYRDHFFASNRGFAMVFGRGNGFGVTKSMKYKYLGNRTYKLVNHYSSGGYGNTTVKLSKNKKVLHLRGDKHLFYKISNKTVQY